MNRELANGLSCVVCGIETRRHTGWLLVMENRWLDRVRIFDWHLVLAKEPRVQSVCGEQHLKILLTHWLAHANLQFLAAGTSDWTMAGEQRNLEASEIGFPAGKVVGELAVHRESLSRAWTGSPEALECIVNALIGGLKTPPRAPRVPAIRHVPEYSREFALN